MLLFNCMLCEGKSKSRGCARYQPCFQLHFVIPSLEEGTWAAWLYDVLKPHVREIVVCNPRRNALLKEGSKSDEVDARKLAELLRAGLLRAVYHGENGLQTLRELARSYLTISKDLKRVKNRIEALVPQLGHVLRGQAGLCRTPSGTMVEQDCAGRRAPPRRAVLSTAGWTTGFAEHRAWRAVGRKSETSGRENIAPGSLHRPASGGTVAGPDADPTPVSQQEAVVDI
jgi:hypothetical protein